MQDLLRAAEKALASGLGDWHLQSIQDISPEFEQHVLMGALGPETLKHKHQLSEPQILHIYGLLHRHCTGFQQEVQAATAGAEHREGLLAHIWTAFAQLWDECTQVSWSEPLREVWRSSCSSCMCPNVQHAWSSGPAVSGPLSSSQHLLLLASMVALPS